MFEGSATIIPKKEKKFTEWNRERKKIESKKEM